MHSAPGTPADPEGVHLVFPRFLGRNRSKVGDKRYGGTLDQCLELSTSKPSLASRVGSQSKPPRSNRVAAVERMRGAHRSAEAHAIRPDVAHQIQLFDAHLLW